MDGVTLQKVSTYSCFIFGFAVFLWHISYKYKISLAIFNKGYLIQ